MMFVRDTGFFIFLSGVMAYGIVIPTVATVSAFGYEYTCMPLILLPTQEYISVTRYKQALTLERKLAASI